MPLCLLLVLLLVTVVRPALAEDVSGPALFIDGDTLTIGGKTIELWGVDAPELAQQCSIAGTAWSCGKDARRHMEDFTRGKSVTCRQRGAGPDQERVYKCAVGTLDLGAELIEVGLALPDWPTSARYYIRSLQEARGKGRGMHEGSFESPWDWRKRRGL